MQIHPIAARTLPMAFLFSFIFSFLLVLSAPSANAQARVNDKDVHALMRNLRDDAKAFRPPFDAAVRKSTIRRTTQERDARAQARAFEKDTATLLERFKKTHNGQLELTAALNSAEQIDVWVNTLSLGPGVTDRWQKIREEIHRIAAAYGVPEPFQQGNGSEDRGTGENDEGTGVSCLQQAGAVKANRLVNECLEVSPATHPPCNAQNSCALIVSEIKRSCALIGHGAPDFCRQYR